MIPAGWCGQGTAAWGLSCLSFSKCEKLPPVSGGWGGMEVGGMWVFTSAVWERSKTGACKGRVLPLRKGSNLLSDLHPIETKSQYCWTHLAPHKAQSCSKQCLSKNSFAKLLVYCIPLMLDINFLVKKILFSGFVCWFGFLFSWFFPHFFPPTSLVNLTQASRATLDSFLAHFCTQTPAAKLESRQDGRGRAKQSFENNEFAGNFLHFTQSRQSCFGVSDAGKLEDFFFSPLWGNLE